MLNEVDGLEEMFDYIAIGIAYFILAIFLGLYLLTGASGLIVIGCFPGLVLFLFYVDRFIKERVEFFQTQFDFWFDEFKR